MPTKALVAYGALFALGGTIILAPVCCSAATGAAAMVVPTANTAPVPNETPIAASMPTTMPLTLDDAITRTLQQHPQLASFAREVEAREFEARQAGLYPNPELALEMENFAGSGDYSGTDSAETTVLLSQRLELGNQRTRRQELGRRHTQLAEQEYQLARADMVATTTTRYIALLAAEHRLALAEEQAALAGQVLAAVNERIAAGKSAQIESLRFQTLAAEAQLRRLQARQELTAARQQLTSLWGEARDDLTVASDRLELLHPLPDWAELTAGLDRSPALGWQQARASWAAQDLAMEQAKRIPDLTLSLGVRSYEATDDNALVAGIAITLPLFDRNQGAIGAARVRQAQARDQARAARLHLQTELSQAWVALQATRGEAVMLRDQLLPAVQQSFDAISYGYRAGKFGFLEVLDAEQTLFTTKSRYIDSLEHYHQSVTELERLLGRRPFSAGDAPTATTANQRGQS